MSAGGLGTSTLERLQARLETLYGRLDGRLGGVPSLPVRTALAFNQDDGPLMARSIANYALFAVFPAILVLTVAASVVRVDAKNTTK